MTGLRLRFHAFRFLKVWLVLGVSYLFLRVIYNLVFYGWLELRLFVLFEVILLPLGQAAIFCLLTAPRTLPEREGP